MNCDLTPPKSFLETMSPPPHHLLNWSNSDLEGASGSSEKWKLKMQAKQAGGFVSFQRKEKKKKKNEVSGEAGSLSFRISEELDQVKQSNTNTQATASDAKLEMWKWKAAYTSRSLNNYLVVGLRTHV